MPALPKVSTIHFRRRIALASAAAAFLVTADVVLPDRPGATAEAAEVLNNAAAATIQTSDPVVGPGQYMKVETTAVNGASAAAADGSRVSWLLLNQTVLVVLNEVDILRQVSDTCRALITALSLGQRSARRRFTPTEYLVRSLPCRDHRIVRAPSRKAMRRHVNCTLCWTVGNNRDEGWVHDGAIGQGS
jgi:hypothetical protein